MGKFLWAFSEPVGGSIDGFVVRTDWQGARVRLKTLTNESVVIVYPFPWNLESFQSTSVLNWTQFYLEALALGSEFEGRVSFRPLQSGLNALTERDSVCAYLTELANPDASCVLEALEMTADVGNREPWVRSRGFKLNQPQALSLLSAFSQVDSLTSALVEAEKKHTDLCNIVDAQKLQLDELQKESEAASERFAKHLKLVHDDAAIELEKLKQDHEQQKSAASIRESELRVVVDALRQDLATALASAEQQRSNAAKRIKGLENEIEILLAQSQAMQDTLVMTQSRLVELEDVSDRASGLQVQVEMLSQQLANIERERDVLIAERSAEQGRTQALQLECAGYQSKIVELSHAAEVLQNSLDTQKGHFDVEIELLVEQVHQAQMMLQRLNAEKRALDEEALLSGIALRSARHVILKQKLTGMR